MTIMQAHIPTMFMMVIIVSLTMTICTALVWRPERKEGLGYWTLALALHSSVYTLYSLRGELSDFLTIIVANTLLAGVFVLFAEGLMQFQQRRLNRWLTYWPLLVVPLVLYALLDQLAARVVVMAAIVLYQAILVLVIVFSRHRQTDGRGQYFLITAFGMIIATMAYRGVGTALGMDQMLLITSSNPIQMATFLTATVSMILVGMGLILMVKERADAQMLKLAMHDELTGLPNRRYILEVLERLLAASNRQQQPLSLMMLDTDHFKLINDRHGHQVGDQSLKLLADTLRSRLRAQDHAGRLGGEEFLVVLPNTQASGARELAEQLRQSIEQSTFLTRDSRPLTLTISIGLCCLEPGGELDSQQAISRADQALYLAKQNGRNRVEMAA
ncbi:GGDEF domain-containing protein [Pseudomonas jilinensis]|uniref:diguanylate cyclase n=2 Tax=Pseudomonas jilinensis TaxID=2078689 RepID=A0A396RVX1_9PSED|nr:GGDEF domain-containing protein [Pseudomonas jilinensis]